MLHRSAPTRLFTIRIERSHRQKGEAPFITVPLLAFYQAAVVMDETAATTVQEMALL